MTEKQLFYVKLHGKIAKELKTTIEVVSVVRSMAIGQGLSLEAIAEWAEMKVQQTGAQRKSPKVFYMSVLDLLNTVKQSEWDMLTDPISFEDQKNP